MGLARAAVHLLMTEAARRPFSGSIVTLGRQHVYMTADEVNEMAIQVGITLRSIPPELHREPTLSAKGFVSDGWLLESLGFDQIVRVDYSNYEEVDCILDLNEAATPIELQNRFDVVLDSGTLEHVFDIGAGLRNCVRMVTRDQGRVIHLTPTSNCVEHGFYSVSPTLFADFYSASGFHVDRVWICEIPIDLPRGEWRVYDYLGSTERFISLGQLNDRIWFTFSVATSSNDVRTATPQQSFYTTTWQKSSSDASPIGNIFRSATEQSFTDSSEPIHFEEGSKSQRLMRVLEKVPVLQRMAAGGIRTWREWRHSRSVKQHRIPYPFIGKF